MNGYCYLLIDDCTELYCKKDWETCAYFGHKPDPNESPSSPRTSGSPTGSRSDSAIEGTGTQLAPVLRPDCGAFLEHDWELDEASEGMVKLICHKCDMFRKYYHA